MPQINLLGKARKKKHKGVAIGTGKQVAELTLLPILLLMTYGLCFFVFLLQPLMDNIESSKRELSLIEEKVKNIPDWIKSADIPVTNIQNRISAEEKRLSQIADFKSKRNNAMLALTAFHKHIPDEVWIDSLSFTDNVAVLTGRTANTAAVFEFKNRLGAQPEFKEPKVIGVVSEVAGSRTTGYTIQVEIKNIFDA